MQVDRSTIIESGFLLGWFIFGANMFVVIKMSGFSLSDAFTFESAQEISMLHAHLQVTAGGLFIGTLIILYENYYHPRIVKSNSFLVSRIAWQIDVALLIIIPNFLVFTFSEMVVGNIDFIKAAGRALNFLTSGLFLSFFIYYYILSIVVGFFRRLHKTFGQHVFYNYLTGKYAKPIEENRVFMFIDLNDSTSIAEAMGHTKYSRMLNRSFEDIICALKEFDYDIYQFVGDEIVLTWLTEDDKGGQAFDMFRAIKAHLALFKDFYFHHFGILPTYKASISCGEVTATLVGDKEKNVAYHGDVLNTTARLLGICKEYKKDLLFTEFYNKIVTKTTCLTEVIAQIKLKGKSNTTNVYAIPQH